MMTHFLWYLDPLSSSTIKTKLSEFGPSEKKLAGFFLQIVNSLS